MLTAYSLNQTVDSGSSVPLNNIVVEKGCNTKLAAPATINLNKRGVYMVTCNASCAASSTIALMRNGTIMPNTQMAGTSPSFSTLVQVFENNTNCCCTAPVSLQIVNPTDASETFTAVNVTVTQIC